INPMRTRELVWSPVGKNLVAWSDQQVPTAAVGFWLDKSAISLWIVPPGFAPPGPGMALADAGGPVRWSPSGELLATGGDGGQVGLWTANGKRRTSLEGSTGAVPWSPDGMTLATGSEQNEIL